MQNFTDIPSTRTLSDSLAEILNNDKTAISCSSGTAFPTANLQLGMLCFRTDQNKLYILKATSPSAVWVEIMDVTASSGKAPNAEAVDGIDGSAVLLKASNLSDLANTATARTNLGIGNVENKSSATIRSEITSANVTSALGYAPQQQDSELTTLAQMSASRATFLASTNDFTFRNRIINGDMRIDQRNNGASVTTTSGGGYFYSVDRFITYNLAGVNFTTQRVAEAPAGFTNSAKLTFANAFSLTTTGEATFQQVIEGFNIADLGWGAAGAQSITISFWVRASFTGTFSVGVTNSAGTRAYATTYTINAANTWEQKTVTIPGDTSGTWLTDNGAGLFLRFMLASGSNFVVSSNNTWTTRAGAYNAADSIYGTRAIGAATSISAGSAWQVTGVQLEAGSVATPFECRDYGRELMMCQRYFEICGRHHVGGVWGSTFGTSGGTRLDLCGAFKVPKRAAPTCTSVGTITYTLFGSASQTGSNQTFFDVSVNGVSSEITISSDVTGRTGTLYTDNIWANAEL